MLLLSSNRHWKPLFLLLACLCLDSAARVWAQPVPAPAPAKVTSATQKTSLVKFVITNPSGGATGTYLPSTAEVSPETKDYYVSIAAFITVPRETDVTLLPNAVQMWARRVRLPVAADGETHLIRTNETLNDLPELKRTGDFTISRDTVTYFYSNLGPNPLTASEALYMAKDWNVSNRRGRWELTIQPDTGASSPTQFKIDKRGQIANYAVDWANYYAYKVANAADEEELNIWSSTQAPQVDCGATASLSPVISTRNTA